MPNPHVEYKMDEKQNLEEKSSLKGTFISVMVLGGLIIVSWVGVWMLYLSR